MNNYLRKEVIKNMFYVGIILAFAAICTYFISLGIILILKKIPVVKRIVA